MSGGAPIRGFVPEQHSFEETSQRLRVVGDAVDFTCPGIDFKTSRTDSDFLTTELTGWLMVMGSNTISVYYVKF